MVRSDNEHASEIQLMDVYAKKLISHAGVDKEMWSFRYDDTLSSFYCKRAKLLANTKSEFEEFIKEAKFYLLKAQGVSPNDPIVLDTERLFKSIKTNSRFSRSTKIRLLKPK